MARIHPRICANCQFWDCFDVDYSEFPEDECGSCKKNNSEVMLGDTEACKDFKADKRPRVRAEEYWM